MLGLRLAASTSPLLRGCQSATLRMQGKRRRIGRAVRSCSDGVTVEHGTHGTLVGAGERHERSSEADLVSVLFLLASARLARRIQSFLAVLNLIAVCSIRSDRLASRRFQAASLLVHAGCKLGLPSARARRAKEFLDVSRKTN